MRVGIIANARAGAPGSMRIVADVERFVGTWADECRTVTPQRGERLEAIASELAPTVDLVLAVGGDGTLNGVVNGLVRSGATVPVAFVPAGRGKDAARTLGGVTGADFGRADVAWTYRPVDVGRVVTAEGTDRFFLNISTCGLGATSARIASRLPRLPGTTCYLLGAGIGLFQDAAFTARLCLDGAEEIILEDCRLISVANCRYFGGGLHIAPDASADDGRLEIVTVSGAGRIEILRNIPRVFKGTHLTHPAVRHWQTETISVAAEGPVGVETDGEVVGMTPATFSVLPRALTWAVLA